VVIGTSTAYPGVPGTTTDACTTSAATAATTRWWVMSSLSEVDIKAFIERVNHTVLTVHLVIEKYMVPVLMAYQQSRSLVIYWFNGEQLTPLGTQYTPIETEALFVARQIEDYPKVKEEVLGKWGISLDAYLTVMPEPGNAVLARFGPMYCPDFNVECLIKHIPQFIYLNCVGDKAPEDPNVIMAEIMSDVNRLACANDTANKIRFLVKVDIEAILSNLRDLAIMALAFNEAVQLPPRLSLIIDAYAMESLNKIDNIMSKRVGGVFVIPPALVISQVRDAFNSVASLAQTLTSAIMARQVVKA
jgi:hypothetical protein